MAVLVMSALTVLVAAVAVTAVAAAAAVPAAVASATWLAKQRGQEAAHPRETQTVSSARTTGQLETVVLQKWTGSSATVPVSLRASPHGPVRAG